jgi:hypothetical protein
MREISRVELDLTPGYSGGRVNYADNGMPTIVFGPSMMYVLKHMAEYAGWRTILHASWDGLASTMYLCADVADWGFTTEGDE